MHGIKAKQLLTVVVNRDHSGKLLRCAKLLYGESADYLFMNSDMLRFAILLNVNFFLVAEIAFELGRIEKHLVAFWVELLYYFGGHVF